MSAEATDNDQPIAYVHAELCNIPAHAELEAKLACAEAERETWRDWKRLTDLVTANANAWKARAEATEAALPTLLDELAPAWRETYSDPLNYVRSTNLLMHQRMAELYAAEAALNIIVDRATEWEMKHVEAEAALKTACEALESQVSRLQSLAAVVDAETLSGEELFTRLGDQLHNAIVANTVALATLRDRQAGTA